VPDALVVTGRIATLAGSDGPEWVDAIAIDGGRVVAAGTLDDVEPAVRAGTRRLDLAPDEVAIPGLTDAHLHLAEAALARRRLDLEGCGSVEQLLDRVRAGRESTATGSSTARAGTPIAWAAGRPPPISSQPRRGASSRCGPTTITRSSPAPRRSGRPGSTP
jgi:predicted amidohydrolase YtcJ